MNTQVTPALARQSPSDQAKASPQPTEELAGSIERVTFHNADNGFCLLRIKARGHRDLVTVVGYAPVAWSVNGFVAQVFDGITCCSAAP